ncbi:MAG: YigZ family protein [Clostridia bacterium]|nr:YigZ family protein [Clostridia bacterium]
MKTIKVVSGEYRIENEIKRSRFIATAKGELDQDEAEAFVKSIKKKYPDATHNCYAYVADELGNVTRFSDDGEPSGTAGQPILDVIRKQGLVKTAIVVTRYFGGVKLGAGGLVGAYSGAAADVLIASKILEKKECKRVRVKTDYSTFSSLEKFLFKTECKPLGFEYGDDVIGEIIVPTDGVESFVESLKELSSGRAETQILDATSFEAINR